MKKIKLLLLLSAVFIFIRPSLSLANEVSYYPEPPYTYSPDDVTVSRTPESGPFYVGQEFIFSCNWTTLVFKVPGYIRVGGDSPYCGTPTFSFIPTEPGSYEVRINPYNAYGPLGLLKFSFDVVAPEISTSNLADGFVGAVYSQILESSGVTPFAWSIVSGSGTLPTGLNLNPLTGEIYGTPTAVGTYSFAVKVTDNNNQIDTQDLAIIVHGNTPTGNPIIGPLSGVTLDFTGGVTQEGQTTVASSSSGTQPPSGFKLGSPPIYYNISTTAVFNPPVEVCISYDEAQFRQENNLKLTHFESGQWVNVTTSLDTVNNIICGQVSALSEFALVEDLDVSYLIDEVIDFNLEDGIEQGFLAKLNVAKSALERGQNKTAVNTLKAFINLVKAQQGKKITNDQAVILINDAEVLINQLQGNSPILALLRLIFIDWWVNLLGLISFSFK